MSHFTVMVMGENPEDQLAPYSEQDEDYFVHEDITEDYRESYAKYYDRQKEAGDECKTFKEFCNEDYQVYTANEPPPPRGGYVRLDARGYVAAVFAWGNPNRRWDWYQLGGRWTGFFNLMPGIREGKVGNAGLMTATAKPGYVDQARYCDIDWNTMKNIGQREAGIKYDNAMEALGWPDVPSWRRYDDIRREFIADDMTILKEGGIVMVRDLYTAQEGVKRLFAAGLYNPDQYLMSREQYIREGGSGAYQPYALVKDGKWYGQGTMGWWNISLDEELAWPETFEKLLHEGTAPDTLISLYDCHV